MHGRRVLHGRRPAQPPGRRHVPGLAGPHLETRSARLDQLGDVAEAHIHRPAGQQSVDVPRIPRGRRRKGHEPYHRRAHAQAHDRAQFDGPKAPGRRPEPRRRQQGQHDRRRVQVPIDIHAEVGVPQPDERQAAHPDQGPEAGQRISALRPPSGQAADDQQRQPRAGAHEQVGDLPEMPARQQRVAFSQHARRIPRHEHAPVAAAQDVADERVVDVTLVQQDDGRHDHDGQSRQGQNAEPTQRTFAPIDGCRHHQQRRPEQQHLPVRGDRQPEQERRRPGAPASQSGLGGHQIPGRQGQRQGHGLDVAEEDQCPTSRRAAHQQGRRHRRRRAQQRQQGRDPQAAGQHRHRRSRSRRRPARRRQRAIAQRKRRGAERLAGHEPAVVAQHDQILESVAAARLDAPEPERGHGRHDDPDGRGRRQSPQPLAAAGPPALARAQPTEAGADRREHQRRPADAAGLRPEAPHPRRGRDVPDRVRPIGLGQRRVDAGPEGEQQAGAGGVQPDDAARQGHRPRTAPGTSNRSA